MNQHKVVRIVGGPAFRGLGDSSWEQPGCMFKEPNEEAFGLSKEGLRAGEEEIWRGSGGSRTVFFRTIVVVFHVFRVFSIVFHLLLKWKWATTFTFCVF